MANININSGQTYFFSRSQGSTFIMDSTDHSHDTKIFGNALVVSASAQVGTGRSFYVKHENSSDYTSLERSTTGASSTPILEIRGQTSLDDKSAAIKFISNQSWLIGFVAAATTPSRSFQITDSSILSTAPNTDITTGMVITGNKEIHFPNLRSVASTTGTNAV